MIDAVSNIYELRSFLLESGKYGQLHSKAQPKPIRVMDTGTTLLLSKEWGVDQGYDLCYEAQVVSKLPLTRIAYGTQLSQNLKKIYSAYGLISKEHIHKDIQTIISCAIGLKLFDKTSQMEIVKYAIKSIYTFGEYFFNMTSPRDVLLNDCVFVGNGCKKTALEIRKKFTKENVSDSDQLHEILSCASVLESLNYSGSVICFVGGIKASKYKKTDKIDELDGFIYLPNMPLESGYAYIIEAKNYCGGEDDAEKQLKETCNFIDKSLKTEIVKQIKCAYLKISMNLAT